MRLIPLVCYGVKCMIKSCDHLASRKVGEENIYSELVPDEFDLKQEMDAGHNLTTYLCNDHFNMIMHRDEAVGLTDIRFKGRNINPEPPVVKILCINVRGNDYQTFFEDEPKTWECGHTVKNAIDSLLNTTKFDGKLKYKLGENFISKEMLFLFKERN